MGDPREPGRQLRQRQVLSPQQPPELAEAEAERRRPRRGTVSWAAWHGARRRLLRALLLFPDDMADGVRNLPNKLDDFLECQPGVRIRVRNTFIDADDGTFTDASCTSQVSSEPKDFKPVSSSVNPASSRTSFSSSQVVDRAGQTLQDVVDNAPPGLAEDTPNVQDNDNDDDDSAPSDTPVPAETSRRLTLASCFDRSCMNTCAWHLRGMCSFGDQCRHCHLCTSEDVATALKLRMRRMRKQQQHALEELQQVPAAPAPKIVSDLPSQGSCWDGTCGRGCAWQEEGCKKGRRCFYCHVCPMQADAAQQRERLEYVRGMRGLYRSRRTARAQRKPGPQPAACVAGPKATHPPSRAQAASSGARGLSL